MTPRLRASLALAWTALAAFAAPSLAARVSVVERSPSALRVRLDEAAAGRLYRLTYRDERHAFVWENLSPNESGEVVLQDDRHLRPEQRLRCESRLSRADPVTFDDLRKGPIVGKRRLPYGVPVSTFGGPGYLVPGVSDLKRDDFGNSWVYFDRPPYAILKYDSHFSYQFALLLPDRLLAHDTDASGRLYLLHPGNWISRHGPLGEDLGAWELPVGRQPGAFVSASGLAIDRPAGLVYLADEVLGRVQRFSLDLDLRPYPQTAWGWLGREDLAFTRAGKYNPDTMYYQLDRPRQLCLDGRGSLLVSCEHYISSFDLATGRQVPFGENPVLGWGGSFTDSPFSPSAALDGHWQRHWLAGVDAEGNVYVGDRENEFVTDPRLQVFSPEGRPLKVLDAGRPLTDALGRPVYLTAVAGLAAGQEGVWLVDAAGRIYESPGGAGLRSGGRLHLGPGAAGRQFDLSQAEEGGFAVEEQSGPAVRRCEGLLLGSPMSERGIGNCEREGRPQLASGERSLWLLARMGEPFRVTLFDREGTEIPAGRYLLEVEDEPGLFGTVYDFFRVTNQSGEAWQDVRYVVEASGQRAAP